MLNITYHEYELFEDKLPLYEIVFDRVELKFKDGKNLPCEVAHVLQMEDRSYQVSIDDCKEWDEYEIHKFIDEHELYRILVNYAESKELRKKNIKKEITKHLILMIEKTSKKLDESRAKIIKEAYDELFGGLRKHIDVSNLTSIEAKELGFIKSNKDSSLFLFPLWSVHLIPDGMTVYDALDEKPFKYNKDTANNLVSNGCVSYGVMIEE